MGKPRPAWQQLISDEAGAVDLSTRQADLVARMLGAAARHEAEHKAERQKRQRRPAAEAGRVAGGGKRPFGYADDRITVVDAAAAVIRECAARVLAGESLASILIRDASGSRVWLAHDLFRETIYLTLVLPQRLALHQRIADALEHRHARGAPVVAADLARHCAAAVPLDGAGRGRPLGSLGGPGRASPAGLR